MKNGIKDLTGQRFGRLIVVSITTKRSKSRQVYWLCKCDCGMEKVIVGTSLIKGLTQSCGCLHRDNASSRGVDLIGRVFGKLTVISKSNKTNKFKNVYWNCLCDCGKEKIILGGSLVKGSTQSCGCLQKERVRKAHTKHGLVGTVEYQAWLNMKARVFNKNNKRHKDYGGRGIGIYEGWIDSFEKFLEDMGPCPPKHSLDRIDNDGDYTPDNCRWATRREQDLNRSNNHLVELNGEILTLTEWSEKLGIDRNTLGERINRYGWSVEKALTTPVMKRSKR